MNDHRSVAAQIGRALLESASLAGNRIAIAVDEGPIEVLLELIRSGQIDGVIAVLPLDGERVYVSRHARTKALGDALDAAIDAASLGELSWYGQGGQREAVQS